MEFDSFLYLVRLGIGHGVLTPQKDFDWAAIEDLAAKQGLSAIILDGIGCLPEDKRPPKLVLLQWIGSTLQIFEQRYESYKKTIAEMAGFYNSHGYKMMVLKGFACSLDWPKPDHRPCGDIDIWQFGKQKEADAIVGSWLKSHGSGLGIDRSHHHHTVFYWGSFMVENHYDFVNVHHNKSNASIEKIFKTLGQDDSNSVELIVNSLESVESGEKKVEKVKVYVPSPNLHALFLLRHAMIEFAASGINLRQLLDWAFFVKAHGKEVDWGWLEGVLEDYGMKRLYNVFNTICVEDLGFDANLFSNVQSEAGLKERVLNEILDPAIPGEKPKELFKRVVWKYHRWRANAWKHELCYKESMWSAFWSGVKSHVLKPSSI